MITHNGIMDSDMNQYPQGIRELYLRFDNEVDNIYWMEWRTPLLLQLESIKREQK